MSSRLRMIFSATRRRRATLRTLSLAKIDCAAARKGRGAGELYTAGAIELNAYLRRRSVIPCRFVSHRSARGAKAKRRCGM